MAADLDTITTDGRSLRRARNRDAVLAIFESGGRLDEIRAILVDHLQLCLGRLRPAPTC